MKKILSYIIKYVLPLILGVGIFILLYRQFDTDIILSILQTDMNLFWVACSMLIGLCSFIFRALRWQLQLQALEIKPSFGTICNAVFGTYAFNLILPRFGELWRCTYLANHEKASFSRILGSVVSDRFADMLMVALITATVFLSQISVWNSLLHTYPQIQETMQALIASPWPYLAIAALVIVVIWLATCKSDNKWISKTRGFLGKIWEGIGSIASMQGKVKFLIYTLLIWGCYLLQLYLCFFAFDWMHDLGIMQAFVLFVLGSIGMLIPVQGGIGPWHAAVIFGLSIYGIGQEQAGAFALVAHGSQMIVTILLGIYTTIAIFAERRHGKPIAANDCSTQ